MHEIQPRPRQFWSENRWILLGLAWLAGLALGCFGFYIFALENGEDWTAADILYRTLQLVTMNSGAVTGRVNGMLEAARFLLPLLTAFTLLQALALIFQEQGQRLRLRRMRDHVVICGMGRKGSRLARELLGLGRQVVIVEKAPKKEDLALFRRLGAIILDADATSMEVLAIARVLHARHLVCLLGDDGANLRTAYQAFQLTRTRRSGKLTCVVHLASIDLLNLIRSSELSTEQGVSFELETFNVYERTARMLLQDSPGWREDSPPETIPGSLLVIGLGRLGEHLVTQAGHQWHLLHRKGRLRITVVDLDAQEKIRNLSRKNPRLGRVCDIHPVQADLCAAGPLQHLLPEHRQQASNQVYICLGDPILSLQVSLNLLQIPAFDSGEIRMRLSKEAGLNGLLEEPLPGLGDSRRVRTFDFLDHSCSAALILGGLRETLARELHAAYSAEADTPTARQTWEQLPEAMQEANRQQVSRIHRLLNAAGFRILPLRDWDADTQTFSVTEINRMARLEHEFWCLAKGADGWVYGELRDENRRTHPDLAAWDDLPEIEREKNRAVVRKLPVLLARIGFQIDRTGDSAVLCVSLRKDR